MFKFTSSYNHKIKLFFDVASSVFTYAVKRNIQKRRCIYLKERVVEAKKNDSRVNKIARESFKLG